MLGGIQHCCCTYAEEVEPDNHWAAAYQMVKQILQKNYHDLGKAGSNCQLSLLYSYFGLDYGLDLL